MPQSHGRIEGEYKPLIPNGRRLVVRPHETPDYQGSIILPDSVKTFVPLTGVILALGIPLQAEEFFQVGDAVLFAKFGGCEVTYSDGSRVIVLHDEDIMGIIQPAQEEVVAG